jgi:multidrug efflux system membrane fusion protein
MFRPKTIIISIVVLVAVFGVWGLSHRTAHASPTPAAMPAVPVTVLTTHEEPIRTWSSFSGRMEAVDYAQIRPEVSGRITEIRFDDGQTVQAGDILIVIDPRPYKAALDKAKADLASARANVSFAKMQFDRAKDLISDQAIAHEVYDQRSNSYLMAQAALEAAKAELAQAMVDWDRVYVKAPITGRISRPEITKGNFVNAGLNAPVLTTIVSNNGIYADFEIDEQTYLQSIRAHSQGQETDRQVPVELTVEGSSRVYQGNIYSFDNAINPTSGTIRARAKFANEDGSLMPGMFATVRMASTYEFNGILVPEAAVGSDQSKKFVYVVNSDNKVVYRELELGQQVNGKRIVIAGLKSGEKVIIDGLQHVRPDSLVTPTETSS